MIMQAIQEDKIVASLEQAFSINKMVLFVGNDNVDNVLTKELVQLPWSCIITSNREKNICTFFSGQHRQIREYCALEELPNNIFEGNTLPVIRLYGSNNTEDIEDDDTDMLQEALEDECNKILSRVMRKLDFTMQLIVVGYRLGEEDVKRTTLLLRLKECNGAKISFFGLDGTDEETEKLKASLGKIGADCYSSSLGEMLSGSEIDSNYDAVLGTKENEDVLFYKNGKPITIKRSNILRYNEIGTLLTEDVVNEIRPFGRIQQSRWFLNFLTRSSMEGPQWYGYNPHSEFYIKRDFEDALLHLVKTILNGKEGTGKGYSNPVILEGDPASSKSVVLGALAYKVFESKEHPVIYIYNNRLNTRDDLEVLDEFMQLVETAGNNESITLIIWDGASYQSIESMARSIAKYLDDRGRRFLLVCSAYRNIDYSLDNKVDRYRFLKFDGRDLIVSNREEMQVAQDNRNGCFFVHASGELSQKELFRLKEKVKLYAPDLKELLARRWEALEKEDNNRLFDYLYRLIVVMQPPLELGLDRERKKFVQYAQRLLNDEAGEAKKGSSLTSMQEALLKAGFSLEELEEADTQSSEITEDDIHKMNVCIALFSRFKLDCPVGMAIYMLREGKENAYNEIYSAESRRLLRAINSSMPWIVYRPNEENVFCFYYRSALEAEVFLTNHNTMPEDEIEMICKMLDFYAEDYRQNASADLVLKESLQRLIRMIGPNSGYFVFERSNKAEHIGLLEHLDKIIDKLAWLRNDVQIEDKDSSFVNLEITFLREFYGTNWKRKKALEVKNSKLAGNDCNPWDAYPEDFSEETYLLRIGKLDTAIRLANENISRLENTRVPGWEKQAVAGIINTLVVELCQCNIRLEELLTEYKEYCKSNNTEPGCKIKTIKPMQYSLLYRELRKTILSDPLNGYPYIAVFKLFIKEYEKANTTRQYELLSEIRPLVDDAEAYDIENRGAAERDELTNLIAKIRNYSSAVKVSISTLDQKMVDADFGRLFEDSLNRGNAAVISFVCQQELDKVRLTSFRSMESSGEQGHINRLTELQIQKCKEIREFMNRDRYSSCVFNDTNAIYLLLKVTWMAYNGYQMINGNDECQRTYLSRNEWIEINRLCRSYEQCAGATKRPDVVLLQALSLIHISGDFQEAIRLLESLREEVFYAVPRMRVPYLLCDENGKSMLFTGKVIKLDDTRRAGYIRLDGVPERLGTRNGARFLQKNLGKKAIHLNDVLQDLEVGIGYMGLSVYTEAGLNR